MSDPIPLHPATTTMEHEQRLFPLYPVAARIQTLRPVPAAAESSNDPGMLTASLRRALGRVCRCADAALGRHRASRRAPRR